MKLNRRNVLVGLGTIVAGGGAALGTGAFSSVEAERTVDVNTEGDNAALLKLSIENDELSGGGDTIEFNLQNLNQNAVTRFEDALEIEYGGSEADPSSYNLEIEYEGSNILKDNEDNGEFDNEGPAMYFEGTNTLEDDTAELSVVFDLRNKDKNDLPGEDDDQITIKATEIDS